MRARILYLSYDGMTDALGQSQVLAYLRLMAREGYTFDIISFEKEDLYKKEKERVKASIEGLPITWHALPYTKKPPILSTLKDLRAGWRKIEELYKTTRFDIVHCRGYLPALLGRRVQKTWRTRFIFDMRGWWPDEKKESGAWAGLPYRPVYRFFKKKEAEFFKKSDLTVSLTYAGRDEIVKLGYRKADSIMVVPTCVDFAQFPEATAELRQAVRAELGIPADAWVLLYSGSLGGNYPVSEIFHYFGAILQRRPDARLVLLTKTDPAEVQHAYREYGLQPQQVVVQAASYSQVHRYLVASDAGMVVYYPTYSGIGRSPTKLGEYWACGLPVVATAAIGDVDQILAQHPGGGISLPYGLTAEQLLPYADAVLALQPNPQLLRQYAHQYYDLEQGVQRYLNSYAKLMGTAV